MSYQVIARKWRPQSFAELVGQTHISQTLQNALRGDRLHHALLFTGPRGTGKTSTARILAKSLRCQNAKDFVPCHQCPDCEDIASGRSLDVIEIDGASNNGVDAVRELRDSVGFMPSSGRFKLYIIDEVHMLSTSAFNALLKTLEEPPAHVIFVMATTEAHKIPNTILSRCQRFDFRRIPVKAITESLHKICAAEGVQAEAAALWAIARQGDGSMRDSQSLLDQVITFCGKEISQAQVIEVLGLTDRSLLTSTLRALVNRNTAEVVGILQQLAKASADANLFVEEILVEIRNMLFLKLQGPASALDLADSEIEELRELGQEISAEDMHLLFDMALKGATDLTRAADPKLVLEMLLLRMSAAPRVENLLGLQAAAAPASTTSKPAATREAKAADLSAKSAPTKGPLPEPPTEAAVAEPQVLGFDPKGDLTAQWHSLVKRISHVNPMVGAPLESTVLTSALDKQLKLVVSAKKKFILDKLKDESFAKKFSNYLGTFWGQGFSYTIEAGEEAGLSPTAYSERQEQDRQSALRQQVEAHPLMKSANEAFKTQIRSIKEIK